MFRMFHLRARTVVKGGAVFDRLLHRSYKLLLCTLSLSPLCIVLCVSQAPLRMASALLSHEVSDLTLGKPALPCLPLSPSSVRDALCSLKIHHDSELSIWDCSPGHCRCLGKVCMLKIICYLASDDCPRNLARALDAPASVLLEDPPRTVRHVDSCTNLLEMLDLMVSGTQNVVVRIDGDSNRRVCDFRDCSPSTQKPSLSPNSTAPAHSLLPKSHNGREYCWLTQENVLRFLVGSISSFAPLPMTSIEDLGIVRTDFLAVGVEEDAISAIEMIKSACLKTTAVAVVENSYGAAKLVGEISCSSLQMCDESAALALATLSVGDFLLYTQDCKNPPELLVNRIHTRICEKLSSLNSDKSLLNPVSKLEELHRVFQDLDVSEESSDEDCGADSPTGPHEFSRRWFSGNARAGTMAHRNRSRPTPIFCRPRSSMIAVMLQALAHRENHVWVTEEDATLLGIVTFWDILKVLLNHVNVSI